MNNINEKLLTGSWIAFGRIFLGLLWLYEVIWGHNWKWANPKWIGEGAGTWLREDVANAFATGTWEWAGWILNVAIVPYAEFWSYAVTALQLAIAVSLITGLFVRPIAAAGLFSMIFMFLDGHSRIPPFFAIGFLFILATRAGMYYGLDGWISAKLANARSLASSFVLSLIEKPLPDWLRTHVGIPLVLTFGTYFLLQTAAVEAFRFRMVSLDLAVIFGFIAVGLMLAKKMDVVTLTARLMSAFVGYKFLHEIWVRFPVALNGLPGWSTGEQLSGAFSLVAANHWSFMGGIINSAFIPFAGFWAIAFAIIQTTVGIMLIINWKVRLASITGVGYLSLLLLLGFTRYVPFILGLLILAYALRQGIRLHRYCLPVTLTLFAVFLVVAFVGGVIPGDYREQMGSVVAAMVTLFSASFLFTALSQKSINEG